MKQDLDKILARSYRILQDLVRSWQVVQPGFSQIHLIYLIQCCCFLHSHQFNVVVVVVVVFSNPSTPAAKTRQTKKSKNFLTLLLTSYMYTVFKGKYVWVTQWDIRIRFYLSELSHSEFSILYQEDKCSRIHSRPCFLRHSLDTVATLCYVSYSS